MKTKFILLLAGILAVGNIARADDALMFGVEGGVQLNRVSFSKDVYSSDNRIGFFIGPKAKFVIPKVGLGADAAVLYTRRTTDIEPVGYAAETKDMDFVAIPVNVRWEIGSKKLGLFVATGPQWDWYIGNSKLYTRDGLEATFTHSYYSWNIGAGIMLLGHLQLGASYSLPMSRSGSIKDRWSTISGDARDVKMKNRQWQIRLNYFF